MKIIQKSVLYEAEERCLSLTGSRPSGDGIKTGCWPPSNIFTGWTVQILQREINRCKGVLI